VPNALLDTAYPEHSDGTDASSTLWIQGQQLITSWFDEDYDKASAGKMLCLDEWLGEPEVRVFPIGPALEQRDIRQAIEASRRLLELVDDWDEEGAPAYAETTWERATSFLSRLADDAKRSVQATVGIPLISPAGGGSIDLYWESPTRTLLINIPAEEAEPASYFGRAGQVDTISGLVSTDYARRFLIAWLTQT
jgi:hypothetical protein